MALCAYTTTSIQNLHPIPTDKKSHFFFPFGLFFFPELRLLSSSFFSPPSFLMSWLFDDKISAAVAGCQGQLTSSTRCFQRSRKKISKVSKRLGCYAFSFIVCAFSSSSSFLRFVYCASYALICDVIFKPPFYLPYSPFLKRKSDQNKIPADPPLTVACVAAATFLFVSNHATDVSNLL